MQNIADLITYATTGDLDIMAELSQAREEYWQQRNQPEAVTQQANRFRQCSADSRLIAYCANFLRSNRRLATEDQVLRQCLRLSLRPAHQIRELRRARYI